MVTLHSRPVITALLVSLSSVMVACTQVAPSRYDQVQRETTQSDQVQPGTSPRDRQTDRPTGAKKVVNGRRLNRYFPRSGNGFSVIPAQEKRGFAEYKLNQGGKTVAMLSINDTVSNPAAAEKFERSRTQIGGFPAVSQGQTGTAVLVGDRFQVKALSRNPAFTSQDRAKWIQKFDLNGLSNLK